MATAGKSSIIPYASLASALTNLYCNQKTVWEAFAQTCAGLAITQHRHLEALGTAIEIQYNPRRLGNITAAPLADQLGAPADCFLCDKNLPELQIGAPLPDDFLLLCNPKPIFAEHFTIAHREHLPQTLLPYLPAFLNLTRGIAPRFCLFFNGAQSGASLPKHLHFQAIPTSCLPIISAGFTPLGKREGVTISRLNDGMRQALCLEGEDTEEIANLVKELLTNAYSFQKPYAPCSDALINIIAATVSSNIFRVFVIFRAQMRPTCFYAAEPDRMLISPGSVEMGGCIVTARKQDFCRLNLADVEKIFREVSITDIQMQRLLQSLALLP